MFVRILFAAIALPSLLLAAPPSWWTERGVLESGKAADDYSAANQGQVKNIALRAYEELQARLPGGAGAEITALINGWRSSTAAADDFSTINVGQLRKVAKPFYDRLIAVGYVSTYPWPTTGQNDDDFAAANLGQVKNLFSFDVAQDTDADGLQNWWEARWFPGGASATDDPDGDGLSNLQEFQRATNPTSPDSDGDGFSDGDEVANGTDANNATDFGRLERSVWTGLAGTKVTDLTRSAAFAQTPTVRDYTTQGAIAPSNYGTNFGQRLRGTVRAPVGGTYTFWIASDDSGELWLGSSESRFSKRLVAAVNGYVTPQNWDASYSQKSVSVELVAGQRYWVEALAKQEGFDDHLAVAWQYPGQSRQAIPAKFLRSPTPDATDSNDDNLPDAWAAQHNVSDGEYGDSDNDGLSNFDEYRYGSDPKVAGGVPGYLSRDAWYGLYPSNIVTLTHDRRFLSGTPDRRDLSPGVAFPSGDRADYWGQRFRGTLTAPATGTYTFYVAADDNAQLWLSTDDRKFQKKRIAWVEGFSYTGASDFSKYLTQKSAPVTLVAGGKYYIEIIHTDVAGPEHVEIAWQKSGEVNAESIPPNAFQSFARDWDDVDDDDLPDTWETQNGLRNRDGGESDTRQGSLGDYDGDGLTNREEYILGTKPVIADSDGDSINDFDEVTGTHTNPLVQDLGASSDIIVVAGSQATSNRLGQWISDGGDIYAADARGFVEYAINIPNSDIYRLEVEGLANRDARPANDFDLLLSVDGESLGHSTLSTLGAATGKVGVFSPWLTAGAHVVRVFWDNAASAKSLRIKFLRVQAVAGADTNGNGVKDWAEGLLASRNGLTTPGSPIGSYVSPACLEGRGRFLSMMSLTASSLNGIATVAVKHAPRDGWYANVPLAANATTAVTASAENGGLTETRDVRWLPTNILAGTNLTIRKGDRLLLTAHPGAGDPPTNGATTIIIDSTQYSTTPSQPIPYLFGNAGTYTVSGSFTNGSQTTTGSITVTVLEHNFVANPDCWVARPRSWDVPNIPTGVVLDADPRLQMTELAPTANTRQFQLQIDQNEPRYIVARINGNGLILSAATANGFRLFGAADTYNNVVGRYTDGSRLVEVALVVSPVPANATVRIRILVGGITFDDGTIQRDAAGSSFDTLGQYKVRFLVPAAVETSNCHTTAVTQGEVVLGVL